MDDSLFATVGKDGLAALPVILVSAGAIVIVLVDLFRRGASTASSTARMNTGFSVAFLLLAAIASAAQFPFTGDHGVPATALSGLVYLDQYTAVLYLLLLFGTLCTLLLNRDYLAPQGVKPTVDIDALVLLAAAGGMVMVSAANLMVFFLGFEILSVAVYVLTGTARHEKASSEGALKYFILGAFSSAFLLYGIVLVFGVTGTMTLHEIAQKIALTKMFDPLLLVGLGLMLFGFAFKVSLVPFHFWTPDAYQGAPSSLTTFMAVVVKAAAFGSFVRIMAMAFADIHAVWEGFLWAVAAVTMTVGNLAALRQKSIKRLLAYSSIAHAGYAMLGIVSGASGGWAPTLFYLVVYTFMTIASFGVVLVVSAGTEAQYERDSIESLRGLGWTHPMLGFVMAVAILSLAGMPPFAGFFGKFYLFKAAIQGGFTGLAIIAALNSAVSLYYYLSVLVVMYFSEATVERKFRPFAMAQCVLLVVTIATCLSGIFADTLFRTSRTAAQSIVLTR